jgi:hypothetical protein
VGALLERGRRRSRRAFWNASAAACSTSSTCDHRAGPVDAPLRPNQILAVGGLPLRVLAGRRAGARGRRPVERELWTPLGLRTLAPGEPGYAGATRRRPRARDAAYHQGTAWPWLLGPFVEAWVRVRGGSDAREARGARALRGRRSRGISTRRAWATSARSPTATRRTARRVPVPGVVARRAAALEHVVLKAEPATARARRGRRTC